MLAHLIPTPHPDPGGRGNEFKRAPRDGYSRKSIRPRLYLPDQGTLGARSGHGAPQLWQRSGAVWTSSRTIGFPQFVHMRPCFRIARRTTHAMIVMFIRIRPKETDKYAIVTAGHLANMSSDQ